MLSGAAICSKLKTYSEGFGKPMARSVSETKPAWVPTEQMAEVIDLQATGYSLLACSRVTDIPVQTIWSWNNELAFSEQYRLRVQERTEDFNQAKDSVHDQQVVMALQVIQEALSGELTRERNERAGTSEKPLRYEAAIELLRATFWKQKAGGHKQFGAS